MSFCPLSVKRTEGHDIGRISLNSRVDLPTYIYKLSQSTRVLIIILSMNAHTEITNNNSILNSAFDKYYYLFK